MEFNSDNQKLLYALLHDIYQYRNIEKYYHQIQEVFQFFENNLPKESIEKIDEKLKKIFTQKKEEQIYQYYSLVSELVVGKYLLNKYSSECKFDTKIAKSNKSDVDFQVLKNGLFLNLELKCPQLLNKDRFNAIDSDVIKATFNSRLETKQQYDDTLKMLESSILAIIKEKGAYKDIKYAKVESDKIVDFFNSCQKK